LGDRAAGERTAIVSTAAFGAEMQTQPRMHRAR
jgi:hypothetical protein